MYGRLPYTKSMGSTRVVARKGKRSRLEARISADQKRRLETAARLRGTSLTDFVIASATEAANRAIQESQTLQLTERDQEVFVRALLEPPAPSARLRAAAKRYRERVPAR